MIPKLSLKENAVIAAFSIETIQQAQLYQDSSLFSNGLKCDIYMSFDGFPQFYLDDQYGISEPIAAYLIKEQNTVNPTVQYKALFDKLSSMELLSAFKRV